MRSLETVVSWLLLLVGLSQMAGDLLGIPLLKGLGSASAASPAPNVFSVQKGLETYSTRFLLEWTALDGSQKSVLLTSELYSQLRGPYNRRNVYGAILAYGPILATDFRTQAMYRSVAAYALCAEAPILQELGIHPAEIRQPLRIRYLPAEGTFPTGLSLLLEAPCR